ncbi:MAG: ABC transporter ATP-binding protein [Proteobacteria bacterium]|nr:ABC transporter ATP-binding protein [Pseudomonadota bacterium]
MSLLEVADLSIRYGASEVVAGLSFSVEPGESLGLVGESGSGKTQTALAILGLLPAAATTSGSIRFDGIELLTADEDEMNALRAERIAIVFQDPLQALNPYLRIGQQIRRILLQHGLASGREADDRVIEMLERVGLPDPKRQFGAYPHQLSGGMRQRAMIASALIAEPDLLIADEPTTALDVTVQAQILELLASIRDDTALLLITHDLGIIAGHCERMLVIEQGGLVEEGPTRQVFAAPQSRHMARLLEAAPRLDCDGVRETVVGKTVLDVRAAAVSFREHGSHRGDRRLRAVRDVTLQVRSGETVAVVGESGSGKSSLFRAVLGLIPLQSGIVSFLGERLPDDVRSRALSVKRELQLVFQDPVSSLNPQMIAGEIIGEPLLVHAPELGADERRRRVLHMLEKVGLPDAFVTRFPHELSGGQAQRVAIARALIMKPSVLICDEAVAALDGAVRNQILALLEGVQDETGLSIVFISHDLAVVRGISHRVLVMYLGRLVELADCARLFARPRHPYTRALIDAVPVPDPAAARSKQIIAGEVPSILAPPSGCAFHPRCAYAQDRCIAERPNERIVDGVTVACHRADEIDLTVC